MNYLDIIIIIILVASCVSGYKKGFVSQLTGLAALILGIYLAIKLSKITAPWLVEHFSWSQTTSHIVSFVVILILVSIAIGIIGKAIERTCEDADLGHFNKFLGLFFSLAKSIVFLSIIAVALNFWGKDHSFPSNEAKHKSLLYMPVASVVPAIFPYFESVNKPKNE